MAAVGVPSGEIVERLGLHLQRVLQDMLKTLTWDQRREMACCPLIETDTGAKVYYCDPHSPWQRPSNEQNNALIRRWLSKGTDLNVGPVRLAIIEDNLNTMPREIHGWDSAHTVYTASRNHHWSSPPLRCAGRPGDADPLRESQPPLEFAKP